MAERGLRNKDLLKYKNFTQKRSYNYYVCPSDKYPNFQFINPDEHPDNICMVSCGVNDYSEKIQYKKCLQGKPFTMTSINPNIDVVPSNMYYISRFNPEKTLLRGKLQKLPGTLNKYLNGESCDVIKTILDPGLSCYLLIGSSDDRSFKKTVEFALPKSFPKYVIKKSIREEQWNLLNHYYKLGINVVIFEYDIDLNDTHIYNLIDPLSFIDSLQKYKSIFILRTYSKMKKFYKYFIITRVTLIKRKKYDKLPLFNPDAEICKKTIKLMLLTIKNDDIRYTDYISLFDLVRHRIPFIQVKNISNLVYEVILVEINGGVIIPIIPSLLNITHKFFDSRKDSKKIKKYAKNNTQKGILMAIRYLNKFVKDKKIKIKSIVSLNEYGNYAGFRLHNDFIIMFKDTKKRLTLPNGTQDELIHIDTSGKMTSLPAVINMWRNIEVYNILIIHIAHYLNEIKVTKVYNSIGEWEKVLRNVYGDSPMFNKDYHMMIQKKYHKMEYYKTHKLKIIFEAKNSSDILGILRDLMKDKIKYVEKIGKLTGNKYRKLCDNGGHKPSMTEQCFDGKLKIKKKLYDLFIDLISREIQYNSLRRYEILENKVSMMTKYHGHTRVEDNVVERIIK
jgi:hypothetical protein